MTSVSTPADRRFLRAHARPKRRPLLRGYRGTLVRWLCNLSVVAGGVYAASSLAATLPGLSVEHIAVSGHERVSRGEVLALLQHVRGSGLFAVDLEDCRRRLLALPWVGEAVIRRVLPATLEVSIVELRPLGIARLGGALFLVDEAGMLIDEYGPKYSGFDLPLIDGLASRAGSGRPRVDARRAALAARVLHAVALRPELEKRISQVDVADERDAVILLDKDTARLRLGDSRFVERIQSYLELAPALRERVPDIDYVDLRFGERVYVGTTGEASTVSQAAAARF